MGKSYTFVFTKQGYESKLVHVNTVTAGGYNFKTEITLDINLRKSNVHYPHPKDMGIVYFDNQNNLAVQHNEGPSKAK